MLLEAVPFWKCLPLHSVEYDQLGLTPKVPHGNTGLKMFLELNDLFILLQKMDESSFFKSGWNLFISHSFTHLRSQQSQLVWQRSLLQIQKKFRLAQSTQGVDLLSGFKKKIISITLQLFYICIWHLNNWIIFSSSDQNSALFLLGERSYFHTEGS